jgi:hypothetical protein
MKLDDWVDYLELTKRTPIYSPWQWKLALDFSLAFESAGIGLLLPDTTGRWLRPTTANLAEAFLQAKLRIEETQEWPIIEVIDSEKYNAYFFESNGLGIQRGLTDAPAHPDQEDDSAHFDPDEIKRDRVLRESELNCLSHLLPSQI